MIKTKNLKSIEITNNHIIIDDQHHPIKRINNIDFKEKNRNLRMYAILLAIPISLMVYFFPNIYSMACLGLLALACIPNRKVYYLYFNNMILPKYHTYDKNEFSNIKEKILSELEKH